MCSYRPPTLIGTIIDDPKPCHSARLSTPCPALCRLTNERLGLKKQRDLLEPTPRISSILARSCPCTVDDIPDSPLTPHPRDPEPSPYNMARRHAALATR